MRPAELVGETQALVVWSSIEPWMMSTSSFSSKLWRHAATTLGLMSAEHDLDEHGDPSCRERCEKTIRR
jgi:hypothetical protein